MANVVSYNDIIELMRSIAERHYQINTFFLGKDWELENNQDIQYPILQVFPQFASMPINNWKEYKTLELTLNCKVVDLTTPAEENEMDVHSDTLRISQDIVNELNQHPYYIRSNVSLMETINFEAIEEFKDDISAGWKFQLKLRIINANTFCGMPIAELDGISANGPTSSGQYVNVRYLTCETLPDCPVIINIQEAIAGLTGATAAPSDLSSVLGVGNSTGNQIITAGTNLSNILQVTDTAMGMSWNGMVGGNVTLDDTIGTLYHDTLAQIESQGITKVVATGRVDIESAVIRSTLDDGFNITRITIDKNQTVSDTSSDNNIVIIDNISNKGIAYFDDYTANFTDNTLVTKGWVSNFVGTNNKFSYTDASNGITSVSNSNTLSKSVLIPANTLTNGSLNIKGRSHKSGTGSFAWLIIYVNTTNSLSGASEIGRINNASNNTVLRFSIDRTIPIKVGSFFSLIINAIYGYEETITNNVSTVTIDWTVDQYIILAVQANGGASPSESLVANFLSVNQF